MVHLKKCYIFATPNISAMNPFPTLITLFAATMVSAAPASDFVPEEHSRFTTSRPDSLYVSSRAIAHNLMKLNPPILAFNPDMTATEHARWRGDVGEAMAQLMKFPELGELPAPRMVGSWQRDGYRIERHEAYPLPGAVVPFLVLIPDGVDAANPAPALLCIPGSGQTKELLAGESNVDLSKSEPHITPNAMAHLYAKEGYVAVAVDNPACGEPADLEQISGAGGSDYVTCARALLELDWSWLGYASYVDKVILDWMKKQPAMRSDRLVVSGFSLGTEPLMALGVMDRDIFAFVYNDFLCSTRERALTMTMPDKRGRRPWLTTYRTSFPAFSRASISPTLWRRLPRAL